MALSCIVSKIKRDTGRKLWFFHTSLASGGSCRNIAIRLVRKTRMVGLPNGEKTFEDMCNCLDTILACDRRTDGWTDRQIDILPWHSLRYANVSGGKNFGRDICFWTRNISGNKIQILKLVFTLPNVAYMQCNLELTTGNPAIVGYILQWRKSLWNIPTWDNC